MCSASRLKRGVIEQNWWVLLIFRIREFSFPQYFCFVFFAVNRDGDIVRESFSVKFILHSLWYTPLVYVFLNLFFQCDLVFVLCFFFSQPDVNITWITGHIHRSIVDKIDPTSEYVEKAKKKKYLINYIGLHFLWNVIRRIYLPCLQFISKTLLMNRDEDPPFFNLKVRRMANYQLKSITSLNPKQQTDLVNNFPKQMSSLAILPLLRLKKGGSSSRFIKSVLLINWRHGK